MTEEETKTVTCCGMLEHLHEQYKGTFYRPVTYDDRMQLHVGRWCVRLYKLTPKHKVAEKGQSTLFLNYCPICGARLKPYGTETP